MRGTGKWIFTAALLTMASAICGAQVRHVIRPGGSAMMLLTTPAVQKELKLTQEQSDKAKEMSEKARKEFMEYLRLDLSGVDRHEVADALEKKRAEMEADQNKALQTLLSAEQNKRLRQLDLQQAGIAGMLRAETAKTLGISDSQKGKLKDLEDQMEEEISELFQANAAEETQQDGNGGVRIQRRIDLKGDAAKKLESIREKATGKAVELLTADQKSKWKELTGEAFKFDLPGAKAV